MTPEEVKDYYKQVFRKDLRMFVLLNPKCKFCKKRSGSRIMCLNCNRLRKEIP